MTATWIVSMCIGALFCAAAVPDPIPFKTLEAGVQSDIERPREAVVRTAAEWTALCADHRGGPQACAPIDFSRTMVLGVFLGTRPSAGFGVEITRIDRDGDALVVSWRETKPGPNDMAAQMITMPYRLVTLDRAAGPVRFVRAR